MTLSFPSSPTVGQQSAQNGRVYQWSGYAWEIVSNISPAFTGAATIANTGNVVPLTVTNTGTANSFVVADIAGDTTPFVIDASGNVGINCTPSGSYSLDVAGAQRLQGTLYLDDFPSATACVMTFDGDSDTGIAHPSANVMTLVTGGAERVRIDSNGVGIGIAPSYRIHAAATNPTNNILAYLANSTAGSTRARIGLQDASTTYAPDIGSVGNAITFDTVGSERMRIDASGNVGIGLTPTQVFHVGRSGTGIVGRFTDNATQTLDIGVTASAGVYIDNPNSGYVDVRIGGTSRLLVDSSGHVGVGTPSPAYALDVTGQIRTTGQLLADDSTSTSAPVYSFDGDTNTGIGRPAADVVTVSTGGSERVRVDASGNVGIGVAPASRLHISGTGSAGYGTELRLSDTAATGNNGDVSISAQTSGVGYHTLTLGPCNEIKFKTGGDTLQGIYNGSGELIVGGTTDRGAYNLQCNGTAVWGAGAYVNGSDERIKEEIAPLGEATAIVSAIQPVTFRYKESWSKDQNVQPGFVAQQLQQALAGTPYLDGVVQQGDEYLSVAYQSLIPLLVKALQESNARIAALEEQLANG